jgi:hypothetical protein
MKVLRVAVFALATVLGVSLMMSSAGPAHAAGGSASKASAAANNPSAACAENTILVRFGPGPDEVFPLDIASHGGGVSTVASRGSSVVAMGDYSHAAYVAQCKLLQDVLPSELWTAPVNIVQTPDGPSNIGGFGDKIETCTWLLKGYHSGTLSHPE